MLQIAKDLVIMANGMYVFNDAEDFLKVIEDLSRCYQSNMVDTMTYEDLLEKQEAESNEFSKDKVYFIFASSESEFQRNLNQKGLKLDELVSIGGGGYVKQEYKEDLMSLLEKHEQERHDYLLNNMYEVIKYYLWDFEMEISISMTLNDLLYDYLGLTKEQVKENADIINKAIDDYKKEFYETN